MKKILIVILVLLMLGLIYIFIKNQSQEVYFKPEAFSDKNNILNPTEPKYLDTIVSVGMDVLGIESTYITILHLPENIKEQFGSVNPDTQLQAFILSDDSDLYRIYFDNINKETAITVMSHELVHLKQYHDGKLKVDIKAQIAEWLGQKYDLNAVPYAERPWEQDAYDNQAMVAAKLKQRLY